jgi:hypothetical protein
VLKGIFRPKRDEEIEGWGGLQNEDLQVDEEEVHRACSTSGDKRNALGY